MTIIIEFGHEDDSRNISFQWSDDGSWPERIVEILRRFQS